MDVFDFSRLCHECRHTLLAVLTRLVAASTLARTTGDRATLMRARQFEREMREATATADCQVWCPLGQGYEADIDRTIDIIRGVRG